MKHFMVAAALLVCAIAAEGEIAFGPARPLTAQIGIGPVPAVATAPVAASSGDQFLVAWNDTRISGYGSVQAARVSADGQVLDRTGIRFPQRSGSVAAVASSGNEYLLATDSRLFVIGRDGSVTSGDVLFYATSAASNGIDYIVSTLSEVVRVDRAGHVIEKLDRRWTLAVGKYYVAVESTSIDGFPSNGSGEVRVSALAPDGRIGSFTARAASESGRVAAVAAGDGEIGLLVVNCGADRVVRFRLDGTRPGADIPILAPSECLDPVLAWNGSAYVVFVAANGRSLAGTESGGAIVMERLPIAPASRPRLISSPRGALAVWIDARFARPSDAVSRTEVAAMMLPRGGYAAAAHDFIVSLSEHAQTSPRIETIGGRQLVAFIESSGEGEEIVVADAGGGAEPLRIAGKGRVNDLRAATNGDEWLLVWSEDYRQYGLPDAVLRAAFISPRLQATLLELGPCLRGTRPAVVWNGSEYLVLHSDVSLSLRPGGVPMPASFPSDILDLGAVPAAVMRDGEFFLADVHFLTLGNWDYSQVRLTKYRSRQIDSLFVVLDFYFAAPAIAASRGELVIVTTGAATTILGDDIQKYVRRDDLWATDNPHVVARDGAFLVTAGRTIDWMRGGAVLASATLPEAAGVPLAFLYGEDLVVLESSAPSSGTLTIAYAAGPLDARANGTARIWLRDVTPRHRAAAR